MSTQTFVGQIVHSKSLNELEVIPNGFVAVSGGKIVAVGSDYSTWKQAAGREVEETLLSPSQFVMPGFVDCHIHAPQMPNLGLGLDSPLLEWLEKYTFPMESRYRDTAFAQRIYQKVVETTIRCGTTLAAYFATNHKESSIILAKEAIRQGQRAFIGKVSSDCNCPSYYVESSDEAVSEARDFVKRILELKSEIVKPIVTPRFALSCTESLMGSLAKIAKENNVNIQSHISENLSEVQVAEEMFGKLYAQVYKDAGLLSNKTVMAHAVHLKDQELKIFKETGTSVAHCPASNTNLLSGMCDVKRIINAGVTVGLGTDVSGGHNPSIKDALVRCLDISNHLHFVRTQSIKGCEEQQNITNFNNESKPLTYQQAIYLATLGGAEALAVDEKVGNFIVGKSFDALVVETDSFPIFNCGLQSEGKEPERDLLRLVQQFIYSGDDRNIMKVFVNGRQIK
ncbi:unnamed protein product [Hermetia illucens]|uniref:Guanine deaminase n=1 Tax=Hermetia illucens TaxID=343691 RepID=A0A7R8YWX8_HERIL|nr:guanine deaminase [Hermetia illucens]CAD7085245.1 unnamed protein product [Hermetia illucens]